MVHGFHVEVPGVALLLCSSGLLSLFARYILVWGCLVLVCRSPGLPEVYAVGMTVKTYFTVVFFASAGALAPSFLVDVVLSHFGATHCGQLCRHLLFIHTISRPLNYHNTQSIQIQFN